MKTKTKGKLVKGIDKRTHKDGTVSYRARVRIKGHPVLIQSFTPKTFSMKWKRDADMKTKIRELLPSVTTLSEAFDKAILSMPI